MSPDEERSKLNIGIKAKENVNGIIIKYSDLFYFRNSQVRYSIQRLAALTDVFRSFSS
jgi:hypothetical protein